MKSSIVRSLLMLVFLVVGQLQAQQKQAMSPQQIDSLTASVALYPDALLAQLLVASTNFSHLQSFAGWLGRNSSLTGGALQEAAQKAGHEACYVALAPFPQVVKMMVEKPDWTKQLGQAFTADKSAVFDSIQRLRTEAQTKGNLETNQQQEVITEKTSSGQQVIVIQPANPQVIYVPQYNPQVVYVQSAPPPSSSATSAALVGFTAGILIGAAANDNYYHGPYGWRGGAMYSEAWEDRYDYAKDLQENRYEHAEDLQENRQEYAKDRQENRQDSAGQRQETYQQNASQRQATAQANEGQRQATAQANQADRATRQSAANTSSSGGGQASQRSGMSSDQFSGYQSGSATRSQSSRGSRSVSSSRRTRR
ncbi:MAG TPA: DUF3300 domain-containing protein [Terriglobia bacterium]|nr:DUF3300 domain-containing protein [Terriglobia bacterium]